MPLFDYSLEVNFDFKLEDNYTDINQF